MKAKPVGAGASIRAQAFAILVVLCLASASVEGQPSAFTQPPAPVTTTNAVLNGMVVPNGEDTTCWFEWGASGSIDRKTEPVAIGDGPSVVRVSVPIGELVTGETYSFRLVASNSLGLTTGAEQVFLTSGKPIVWTTSASSDRPTNIPPNFNDAVAIAAGPNFGVGLKADGRVMVWSRERVLSTDVPSDLTNAVAVAAGNDFTMALKSDGSVVVWGTTNLSMKVPENLRDVVGISAGPTHCLALRADGTVAAWGSNWGGEATVPSGLSNVVAVSAGSYHSLALKADDTVAAWGDAPAVPADLPKLASIAAGSQYNVGLKRDGTVTAWGERFWISLIPSDLSNVVALTSTLAITSDGAVVGWRFPFPRGAQLPINSDVVATASGNSFALLLASQKPMAFTQTAGTVSARNAVLRGFATPNGFPAFAWFEWGANTSLDFRTSPVPVGDGFNVKFVTTAISDLEPDALYSYRLVVSNSMGVTFAARHVLTTGQRVASWGSMWGPLIRSNLSQVVKLGAGDHHGLAVRADGTLAVWGRYRTADSMTPPAAATNVIAVTGGRNHSLALRADGTLVAWGNNTASQATVPTTLNDAVAVTAGDTHSLVLKRDGTVTTFGELVNPKGLSNVVAISSGDTHGLALRNDGTVFEWWAGSPPAATPLRLRHATAVAAGWWHNLVLREDGTVSGWGDDSLGQISGGAGLSNVVAIAAGDYHSLAMTADGSVVLWGGRFEYNPIRDVSKDMRSVAAVASGDEFVAVLAPNTPPQAFSRHLTAFIDQDAVIPISRKVFLVADPNDDPLTFRIVSLPLSGGLFQFATDGRGSRIQAVDTLVTDPFGRVIFSPGPGESGTPYATFGVVASDGEFDSAPSLATINVIAPLEISAFYRSTASGLFTLDFTATGNVTFSMSSSTNLIDWTGHGRPTQSAPGKFTFSYPTNSPMRYFRVGSP